MKFALLCPGPSLRLYPGREGYDRIIGVNRAAMSVEVDTWAATDWISEGANRAPGGIKHWQDQVIGTPLLLTNADSLSSLTSHGIPWRGEAKTTDSLTATLGSSAGWTLYSATSAVVYALNAGARTLDCYGMDWSGTLDFDGVNAGGNRTDARWDSERGIFRMLTELLKGKMDIRRVTA